MLKTDGFFLVTSRALRWYGGIIMAFSKSKGKFHLIKINFINYLFVFSI